MASLIEKVKVELMISGPFFAHILLRKKIEENKSIPTAQTDGKIIIVNPLFFARLTLQNCVAVLCHEVLHIVLLHPFRRGNREPKRWNRACDYAANLILKDSKYILPKGALLNEAYRGMTPEYIYELLPKDNPPFHPSYIVVTGGNNQTGESDTDNPVLDLGEITDGINEGCSAEERKKILDDLQLEIVSAAHYAKSVGKMPMGIYRSLDIIKNTTKDWKEELNAFIQEQFQRITSSTKFNKRFLSNNLVLPGSEWNKRGNFVLAIDTSGSITKKYLASVLGHVKDILEVNNDTLRILYFDSEVEGEQEYENESDTLKPKGGGGTDFKPVIEYLGKKDIDTQVLIYFTDGCCNSFAPEPDYPVLWATDNIEFKPPYGYTMFLQEAA